MIGNPPYVGTQKVKGYRFSGFETDDTPDIYAPCTERAAQITRPDGRMTLILPISAQFGSDFTALRKHLEKRFEHLWVSAYSRNPAALFSAGLGVPPRSSSRQRRSGWEPSGHQTHRWFDDSVQPFSRLSRTSPSTRDVRRAVGWARIPNDGVHDLFGGHRRVAGLGQIVFRRGAGRLGFKNIALYWLSVFREDPPAYELDLTPFTDTPIKHVNLANEDDANLALAIAASKLGFVWWYSTGDDFNVTAETIKTIPANVSALSTSACDRLRRLAEELTADLPNHVLFTKYAGKWMGNYVHAEMRDITDKIDAILAAELGYTDLLPSLEHAYYCAYKPTGDRPGVLRYDPATAGVEPDAASAVEDAV